MRWQQCGGLQQGVLADKRTSGRQHCQLRSLPLHHRAALDFLLLELTLLFHNFNQLLCTRNLIYIEGLHGRHDIIQRGIPAHNYFLFNYLMVDHLLRKVHHLLTQRGWKSH